MGVESLSNENILCRHFVSIVERMFCLHVEHLRMLCRRYIRTRTAYRDLELCLELTMHLSTSFCSCPSFCDDGMGLVSPAFLCRSTVRFATARASWVFLRSMESSPNTFFPSSFIFRYCSGGMSAIVRIHSFQRTCETSVSSPARDTRARKSSVSRDMERFLNASAFTFAADADCSITVYRLHEP